MKVFIERVQFYFPSRDILSTSSSRKIKILIWHILVIFSFYRYSFSPFLLKPWKQNGKGSLQQTTKLLHVWRQVLIFSFFVSKGYPYRGVCFLLIIKQSYSGYMRRHLVCSCVFYWFIFTHDSSKYWKRKNPNEYVKKYLKRKEQVNRLFQKALLYHLSISGYSEDSIWGLYLESILRF